MAGAKALQNGSNSLLLWLLYHMYAARVTILWVLTVLLALTFIICGYVDQFCKQCELEGQKRLRVGVDGVNSIQRRDQEGVLKSNSCLSVNFGEEGSQQLLALASYPGSGNTWLRHLMEHSTGIYTGSVYVDKKLMSGGFHGEGTDFMKKTVLGVKMHRCSRKELHVFESVILLVRNPYNAMVSEWHRYHTSYHKGTVDLNTFRTKEWEEFVEEESSHWERMMRNCLKDRQRKLVIFYENLQNNLQVELVRIHRFLRIPIDGDRLLCTQTNAEGNFHRGSKEEFDPYTREMVETINRRIDNAGVTLKTLVDSKFPVDYRKVAKS